MPSTLVIISGIYPPDPGGPAKFSSEFAEWCATKGDEVKVLTYGDSLSTPQKLVALKVYRVPRTPLIVKRYFSMIREIGKHAKKGSLLAVGAFLETFFASLIYRFEYVAKVPGDIVWERARNNNFTILNIEDFQKERLSLKYRFFRYLYSQSLRRARIVIVPSRGILNLCLLWGVKLEKINLVYNSVDYLRKFPVENTAPLYDLVTVCRLTPWKGVKEIIENASLTGRSLLVIGDGPELGFLQNLAVDLGAKVTFTGNIPGDQVIAKILMSRVFVLNSYYEGLPHALLEARAAGIPTVGRAGTGSEEVINDGVDGFLIRPNRSLSDTLNEVFALEKYWDSICERAQLDTKKRFDKANNFKIIRLIIEERFM